VSSIVDRLSLVISLMTAARAGEYDGAMTFV